MTEDSQEITALTRISAAMLQAETRGAFERVWDTALGLPCEFVSFDTRTANIPDFQPEWFGSVAWIGGSWTGIVRIAVSPSLASTISCRMNATDQAEDEQIDDSMREVANMVAGNLKSVLPGICGLATPGSFRLRKLDDLADDFSCLVSLCYRSEGEVVMVTLNSLHEVE